MAEDGTLLQIVATVDHLETEEDPGVCGDHGQQKKKQDPGTAAKMLLIHSAAP